MGQKTEEIGRGKVTVTQLPLHASNQVGLAPFSGKSEEGLERTAAHWAT